MSPISVRPAENPGTRWIDVAACLAFACFPLVPYHGVMARWRGRRPRDPVTHVAVIAVVALTVLAGCAGPAAPPASGPTDLAADPLQYTYECPPGDTLTLSNGLCVTTFFDPRETFEEPYIAVHPQGPNVMVLAMNAWHAEPRPVVGTAGPTIETGRVTLFATEDGGATWTRVASPPILYGAGKVGKTSYSGDPVVEFDSRGVLHYVQTSVSLDELGGEAFPYLDIQYARSEDLGASWSENVLLADDGDNDRPWLSIGPKDEVLVTWRNNMVEALPPELARSTDGGTTWDTFTAPPECTNGDRAIVHSGGLLLPCEIHKDGTPTGLQINRFDPDTQRFEALGRIPTPDGWSPDPFAHIQWDQSSDGSVLAAATRQKDPSGFITFSRDGGLTWSDPLSLIHVCGCQPETGSLYVYGARLDAWGGFHVMVADAYVETPDNADDGNIRYATGERAVFHVVVDAEGAPRHAQQLTTSVDADPRVPPSAAPPIGRDDYFIPAFWDDGGAIAWTRDKGIDLAHVVPGSSGDAPAS